MEVKPFRYSYRTYLDNPQHVKINQILQNLDKINYKSKNKFISDAIEYYIDHLTSEGVVDVIEDKRFVTEEEMLQLKKEIQENTISLVKDEIIKSLNWRFNVMNEAITVIIFILIVVLMCKVWNWYSMKNYKKIEGNRLGLEYGFYMDTLKKTEIVGVGSDGNGDYEVSKAIKKIDMPSDVRIRA